MRALDLAFTVYLPFAFGAFLGLSAILPGWRDRRDYSERQRLNLHLVRLGAVVVSFLYQLIAKRGDDLGEGLMSVFVVTALGVLAGVIVTGFSRAYVVSWGAETG